MRTRTGSGTVVVAFTLGLLAFAARASGACTGPSGSTGAREFTAGTFKFCDGQNWVPFFTDGTGAACATAGAWDWDSGSSSFKFCNGANWKPARLPSCSVSSLSYVNKIADSTNLAGPTSLFISDDATKAYIANDWNQRVAIYDISGVSGTVAPSLIGVTPVISQINGGTENLVVHNGYLYVVSRGNDNLVVVDVTNPAAPTYLANISAPNSEMDNIWDVDLNEARTHAFTVSWASGASSHCFLHAIDITTPSSPSIVGTLDLTAALGSYQFCNQIRIRSDIAYVAFGNGVLATVNVANPSSPALLGSVNSAAAGNMNAIAFSDNQKYLFGASYSTDSFLVFDIAVSTALSFVTSLVDASYFSGSYGVAQVGKYVLMSSSDDDALSVIDVATPSSPTRVTSVTDASTLNGAKDVVSRGSLAYVIAKDSNTLAVYDLGCDARASSDLGTCTVGGRVEYFPESKSLAYCDGSQYRLISQSPRTR